MRVIVLNGPINTGKTTTGKALADLLPKAHFIDGDDHGLQDDEPLAEKIAAALDRIVTYIATSDADPLIVAYPLRDQDHSMLLGAAQARAVPLHVVTLSPPIDIAVSNRGARMLEPGEVARSLEMYAEGYNARAFSDLVVTAMVSPAETATQICRHFGLGPVP